MAKQAKNALTRELSGIIYLSITILLACSFYSYDPKDVHGTRSAADMHNWFGFFGAYLAYILYSCIGWAANLLPLICLYLGVAALFRMDYRLKASALWMLAFVLGFSCLLQVIVANEVAWATKNNNLGARWDNPTRGIAGMWGYWAGTRVFQTIFGQIGSVVTFLLVSGASLFMALQIHPRAIYVWVSDQLRQRKVQKREEALRSGDIKTVLRTREQEIAERQRLIERELSRRGKKMPPETKAGERKDEPLGPGEEERAPSLFPDERMESKPEKQEYKINRPTKAKAALKPQPQPTAMGPYSLPPHDLLRGAAEDVLLDTKEEISIRGAIIETTLRDFGIHVRMGEITQGATITRFEVVPSPGVKVERIVNLQNNLSLALKADKVNILAPVAGKGTVGIEVANTSKAAVLIRELIESSEFQNSRAKIPLAIGKDVYGKTLIADLAEMPHLLIAGSTGSGKSVCINAILSSILYKFSPDEIRLILIDPKVVELQIYNTLPHLVVPVVSDPKKVIVALRWVIREMEKRYAIMAKVGVRNIAAFNARSKQSKAAVKEEPSKIEESEDETQQMLLPEEKVVIPEKLPYIVVFIDELADLMLTAPVDAEDAITRITQMARAAGIHLIVATQTPRADIVTGTIKTNLPSKISFRVASKIDSRVILDENGAENLLGKGDMFYKSSDSSVLVRAQGAFISDDEVRCIVDFCGKQAPALYDTEIQEKLSKPAQVEGEASDEDEELIEKCIQVIRQEGRASTSLLQRRLRLGYTRAARVMDALEERGVVGPAQGAKDREILIRLEGAPEEG